MQDDCDGSHQKCTVSMVRSGVCVRKVVEAIEKSIAIGWTAKFAEEMHGHYLHNKVSVTCGMSPSHFGSQLWGGGNRLEGILRWASFDILRVADASMSMYNWKKLKVDEKRSG